MSYRCDQAVFAGAREAIRCKVSGSICAHQKMCMMEGRIVLTDGALRCPARDGKMPGEDPAPARKITVEKVEKVQPVETEKPAKKATRKGPSPAAQDDTGKKTATAKKATATKTAAAKPATKKTTAKAGDKNG